MYHVLQSFIWPNKSLAVAWLYHVLFICSSADGNLDCFHLLALMNNATMNIYVPVFVWIYIFIFLGCVPRGGNAELYGKPVFNILKNGQTVFQSGCTILHSHQ